MQRLRFLIVAVLWAGCALAVDDDYVIEDGEDHDDAETATDAGAAGTTPADDDEHSDGSRSGAQGAGTSRPPSPPPPDPCADGSKGDGETDVDCGGPSCPACAVGHACKKDRDCESNHCNDHECVQQDGD